MAKFDGSTAVAFATQSAEGTYNTTLDAITTVLVAADGLVLPTEEVKVKFARDEEGPAAVAGSFTKPLGTFKRRTVSSLEVAVQFCGNRSNASNPPVDADFVPITGLNALLQGVGMTGAAWGSGVGQLHVYASPNPISCLLYHNGRRYELLDCRVSGEINFDSGSVPIFKAKVEVGSIKDQTEVGLPTTLTYGVQATVSAPIVESVANLWSTTRGFATLKLSFDQKIDDVPDSNVATGFLKDKTERVTGIDVVIYTDDADEDFADTQLAVTSSGALAQISFQVGASGTASNPMKAVQIVGAQPVILEVEPVRIGSKAADHITAELRHDTANAELEIRFR